MTPMRASTPSRPSNILTLGRSASRLRGCLRPRTHFSPPGAAFGRDAELVGALWQQIQHETAPWVADLVFPIFGVRDRFEKEAERAPAAPPAALADPDGNFIDLPCGVTIHYKERPAAVSEQDPSTPTLVFIHGFNASTFSWRSTLDAAASATGWRAIAFDRPPFGLSQRPLDWGNPDQKLQFNPYELNGSVNITEELLDALGVGPIIVIGHSAGALVALELQRRRRAQVSALALVAPAVPTNPEHSFQRRATFGSQLRVVATRAILQSDVAGLRFVRRQIMQQAEKVSGGDLGFVPHPSTASGSLSSTSLDSDSVSTFMDDDAAAEIAMKEAVEGYLLPLRARDWDRGALLNLRAFTLPMNFDYDKVSAPVLVLQGKHDGMLALNARALTEILRARPEGGDAKTSFVEFECGHVPMDEKPEEFNEALIDFLKRRAKDALGD